MRCGSRTHVGGLRWTFLATVLAIGFAGLSTPALAEDAELPIDLAQAWADYDRATISMDVARLADLVADDYLLVNSDASVQDKASYLADFKMPGFRLHPYQIEQPLRKMLGNSAVTGGVFSLDWIQDGRRHRRRLRFAHVWAKRDGRWRISYTQLTRTPEQPENQPAN